VTYFVARHPRLLAAATARASLLVVVAGVLATGVCLLAAGLLAGGDGSLADLISLAALAVVPTLLVLVLRGAAAGRHRWRLVGAEQAAGALLRLLALAVLAVLGHLTPFTATIVFAATPVLAGLVYLRLGRGLRLEDSGPETADGSAPSAHPRVLLGFGLRIWLGSLTGVLLARLDQVLMTPLSSTYQLGLYAVAVNIGEVVLIAASAIRDVTFAADAADRDTDRLAASARISGLLSGAVAVVLAIGVPIGIPIVFGADFAPAAAAAWWLLAALALTAPGSVAGAGLSGRGRPGLRSTSLAIGCAANVIALLMLVPVLGATGAAIATFLGNGLAAVLNLLWLHRLTGRPVRDFLGVRRSDLLLVRRQARTVLAHLPARKASR
jgi:O-antigen/teichoic acid export membrane protein